MKSMKDIKKDDNSELRKVYRKPDLETHKLNYITDSSCNYCATPGLFAGPTCPAWEGS